MSSIGKPWVSCSLKATSPGKTVAPLATTSRWASSRSESPVFSVRANPGLLAFQDLDDEVAVLHEDRVGATHLLDGRVDQ